MDAYASLSLHVAAARPRRPAIASVPLVAYTYAAWLFALTLVGTQPNASKVLSEIVLVAGVVPAVLQATLLPADTRGNAPGIWFAWAFVTLFLASYLVNESNWADLVNVFNVVFVFTLGLLVASCTEQSLIARITAAYAVMTSVYLLYVNTFGSYKWGRLTGGVAANMWGFIALNVAAGAFCLKSRLLALACWAVVVATLYNAQARGSMLAAAPYAVAGAYYLYVYERRLDASWKAIGVVAMLLAVIVVLATNIDFLLNNIMRLDDPYRGLASGATKRDEAWVEALGLWAEHPLLGVGYRNHELYMRFTGLNAHNAQISMLADTGILGLILYMGFLVAAFFAALRGIADPVLRLFAAAVIASYALAGLFERRAINAGNAYSITFTFVCLFAFRHAYFPTAGRTTPAPLPVQAELARDAPEEPGAEAASTADTDPRTERARETVDAYLDVDAIALAGLGRHRVAITTAQWREFRGLLRELIIYGFALHFADLSAGNLMVDRIVPHGSRRATVRSRVRRSGDGRIVSVDWRIRTLTRGGGFKVTDVVIEGTSAAKTLRADVSTIITADGFERVCAVLREQATAMREALG